MSRKWMVGLGLFMILGQGCVTSTGPLATLPIVSPDAAEFNRLGIEAFNSGKWEVAKQQFERAVQADSKLPEAHFNLALTFHKLENHEMATQHFERAGSLAPTNSSIVDTTLYRNYLGLSSTFERHFSGGYRYAK